MTSFRSPEPLVEHGETSLWERAWFMRFPETANDLLQELEREFCDRDGVLRQHGIDRLLKFYDCLVSRHDPEIENYFFSAARGDKGVDEKVAGCHVLLRMNTEEARQFVAATFEFGTTAFRDRFTTGLALASLRRFPNSALFDAAASILSSKKRNKLDRTASCLIILEGAPFAYHELLCSVFGDPHSLLADYEELSEYLRISADNLARQAADNYLRSILSSHDSWRRTWIERRLHAVSALKELAERQRPEEQIRRAHLALTILGTGNAAEYSRTLFQLSRLRLDNELSVRAASLLRRSGQPRHGLFRPEDKP